MNLSIVAGTAALNAITGLAANGTLVFLSGTQPATPEAALSGNTALVTFTFSATPFGSASNSGGYELETASFVSNSVAPAAGGVATFARMYESGGTVVIGDFTVGTSGTDITIGNTTIQTGVNVSITSFQLKEPVV